MSNFKIDKKPRGLAPRIYGICFILGVKAYLVIVNTNLQVKINEKGISEIINNSSLATLYTLSIMHG